MKQKVTMYTIAEELNVSIAAVSRAFDPNSKLKKEKRELILQTAQRLGYIPNASASRLSQRTLQIGVVVYDYVHAHDDQILEGIDKAYQELRNFKVHCDICRLDVNEHSIQQALAVLEAFGDKKYDGVLIVNIPRALLREKIDQLDENGCKVVLFDADIPQSKRLFTMMNNFPVATGMVVDLLRMKYPVEPCTVAVFAAPGQEKLVEMFQQQAGEANIHIVRECILDMKDSVQARTYNEELVHTMFAENPSINGVYITNANCLPICRYLENSPLKDKVMVIASDIFDQMRPYIQNGVIDASIYQDPVMQGYEAMKQLYSYLAEKKEVSQLLLAHPQVILKSNLSLF